MASIKKRGDSYLARIRRRGYATECATFPSKSEAIKWAMKRESEIIGTRRGIVSKHTVREAIARYREEVTPGHRGRVWEVVRLNKIERELGFIDRSLSDVLPSDISEWRDGKLKTLATSSVRREYGLLRSVFSKCAREWGWLIDSPFRGTKPPDEGKSRKQRVSDAEADAIIAQLDYARGERPRTHPQFVAAAFLWCIETAMRQGEALSLERSDILAKVAHLDRTKNGSERDVPLSPAALAMLELLPDDGYLFPVSSRTCDVRFRKARSAAGLRHVNFHDSRREGTWKLSTKLDPLTLAKVTGHKTLKVLIETYYHPDMQSVADKL